MGRFDPPDPAWEEEFERSKAMMDARCIDCGKFKGIPKAHGDPKRGYCPEEDGYVDGMGKVTEIECEDFEWRKWW